MMQVIPAYIDFNLTEKMAHIWYNNTGPQKSLKMQRTTSRRALVKRSLPPAMKAFQRPSSAFARYAECHRKLHLRPCFLD